MFHCCRGMGARAPRGSWYTGSALCAFLAACGSGSLVATPSRSDQAFDPRQITVFVLNEDEYCGLDAHGVVACGDVAIPGWSIAGQDVVSLAAGGSLSCALSNGLEQRLLTCWDYEPLDRRRTDFGRVRVPASIRDIGVGPWGVCAHGAAGQRCMLLRPPDEMSFPGPTGDLAQLSVGVTHSCWIRRGSGIAECDGIPARREEQAHCSGRLTSGDRFSCCEVGTGISCWGDLRFDRDFEVPVPLTGLAAGDRHVCLLDAERQLQCFGWCPSGRCGLSQTRDWIDQPTIVRRGGAIVALAASGAHTCVVFATGDVECW